MAATAVKTLVSEEQYLHGHFGDRTPEYVDGEIVERTMPNNTHARIQTELTFAFRNLRDKHQVHTRIEIRLKVAPGKYRIPDLGIFWPEQPIEEIPEKIPFLVIEIVSPDDTWSDVANKVKEYLAMGVSQVWLVDPQTRSMVVHTAKSQAGVEAFELPQFGLKITIDDLLP